MNSQSTGLTVAWPRYFPQSACQQDFGADGFKAISTSHTLRQLHQTIQRFSVSSSVAVGEVVKNGVPVVLYCQRKRIKSFSDIRCDLREPGEVLTQGFLFCWSVVDAVKGF